MGILIENPQVRARLYPELPKAKHVCFYPMDKRRPGDDNWYMLSMEERRNLMRSHGMIGRRYAGKVKQIITGSVGFDDYEWGVTLCLQMMRFNSKSSSMKCALTK